MLGPEELLEQLSQLPPGLQMLLLNTEVLPRLLLRHSHDVLGAKPDAGQFGKHD